MNYKNNSLLVLEIEVFIFQIISKTCLTTPCDRNATGHITLTGVSLVRSLEHYLPTYL
jgi:hypothetical protein